MTHIGTPLDLGCPLCLSMWVKSLFLMVLLIPVDEEVEVVEYIPGCNVALGLPRPRQAVDWLICSPILGLVKDLSSLDWLLLKACGRSPYGLRRRKAGNFEA